MREILFIGKSIEHGGWEFGHLVTSFGRTHIVNTVGNDREDFCEVEENTVGQFTGLLDKNGKKIFEGDLFMNGQSLRIIEFYNGNFTCIKPDRSEGILLSFIVNNPKNTVIGNINDNPELIK